MMVVRSALISATCLLCFCSGMARAEEAQQARPTVQQPSHRGKAMRDCHRQMKAGGSYETLPVEQRRKAMTACLQAKKEEALKQADLEYRAGAAQR